MTQVKTPTSNPKFLLTTNITNTQSQSKFHNIPNINNQTFESKRQDLSSRFPYLL